MEIKEIVALVRRMDTLKRKIDTLDDKKKVLQKEYDSLRNAVLPDAIDSSGLDAVPVRGLGQAYLFPMFSTKLHPDNPNARGELHAWLIENGHGDLIIETVHPSTLNAFVKEQVQQGDLELQAVDQFLQVNAWSQARIRRK